MHYNFIWGALKMNKISSIFFSHSSGLSCKLHFGNPDLDNLQCHFQLKNKKLMDVLLEEHRVSLSDSHRTPV